LKTATYDSKTTSQYHLVEFYQTFSQVKGKKYDGMIITGAPIELLDFEEVDYWSELREILDWTITNVTSTLHICWGAQAALYYHYGIRKYELPAKCSGIYKHLVLDKKEKLLRGFDDEFLAPHSRNTDVSIDELTKESELKLLVSSEAAGPLIISSRDGRRIMITGHLEYEASTLGEEYARDRARGISINMPENYFPGDNSEQKPLNLWRSHAHLFFSNWLNYYVYQETPYKWD
jgi:homoserine O-succinyltransferase/O-acetyltransferase